MGLLLKRMFTTMFSFPASLTRISRFLTLPFKREGSMTLISQNMLMMGISVGLYMMGASARRMEIRYPQIRMATFTWQAFTVVIPSLATQLSQQSTTTFSWLNTTPQEIIYGPCRAEE